MNVIYTDPRFRGLFNGHGYEHYKREVDCTCGKKIGTQSKYEGWDSFCFDNREMADYKFCPYCGKDLNE
jgi:hypothetical protein